VDGFESGLLGYISPVYLPRHGNTTYMQTFGHAASWFSVASEMSDLGGTKAVQRRISTDCYLTRTN
jgi:hypothetical protein